MKLILSFIVIVLFSGCESMAPIEAPNQHVQNVNGLVLGHLIINDTDNIGVRLLFKNLDTGKGYYIEKWNHIPLFFAPKDEDGTGYFSISLPPGRYYCFRLVQEGLMQTFKNINLYFDVSPSSTIYIGSLIFAVHNVANVLYIVGTENIVVAVANDRDDAIEYFKNKGYSLDSNFKESILRKTLIN